MSDANHAGMKHWAMSCRVALLSWHTHNNGDRRSYEVACLALAEITEFIVEYHGRATAVATLERLAMATEAKLPLPAFTTIEAMVSPIAPPEPTRELDRLVGARAARILRKTSTSTFLGLVLAALALLTLRHFFP